MNKIQEPINIKITLNSNYQKNVKNEQLLLTMNFENKDFKSNKLLEIKTISKNLKKIIFF